MHYDEIMAQERMTKGRGTRSTTVRGPAFEQGTGFLLSRVGAMARQRWGRMLAELDLTPHHYGMLMILGEQGSVGPVDLSTSVGIDPRNAVPIVDGLIERGLLVRTEHPTDRRRRVLTLTPHGRETTAELVRAGAEIESRFLEPLSRQQQQTLNRLLTALASTPDQD